MSGETVKLVKVEEIELRQLRRNKSRVRPQAQNLPEQINATRNQTQHEFQQHLSAIEQRNKHLEQQTTKLKTSLANSEKETAKRLQQQQQELRFSVRQVESHQQQQQQTTRSTSTTPTELEQQRAEYLKNNELTRQGYSQLMQQQEEKFNNIIAQERDSRAKEQQIQQMQLQQVVGNLEQERQRKQQLAQDLLSDVQTIWEQINQNYQHQRFAPGRLADLSRHLEMARANLQAGISEAAIANAQQTYLALADLRLSLTQKEQEWLLLYKSALEDVRSLIAEAQSLRQCEVEVGEGNEVEKFSMDVDYWSNGRLSQYEQQLRQLESQLVAGKSMTTEQVRELSQRIAPMSPTLEEIIEQAQLAVLSSQMRAEIADSVVDALSSLGYTLVDPELDAIYEGNDQRQAYVVKVKNLAGDEVVTVINPEKEFGVNSISLNAFSESIVDETAAQQNAQAIFEFLESEGVKGITPMQCNASARAEYQNMQAVKQRQTAKT